jgi:hypothetical protein
LAHALFKWYFLVALYIFLFDGTTCCGGSSSEESEEEIWSTNPADWLRRRSTFGQG